MSAQDNEIVMCISFAHVYARQGGKPGLAVDMYVYLLNAEAQDEE